MNEVLFLQSGPFLLEHGLEDNRNRIHHPFENQFSRLLQLMWCPCLHVDMAAILFLCHTHGVGIPSLWGEDVSYLSDNS